MHKSQFVINLMKTRLNNLIIKLHSWNMISLQCFLIEEDIILSKIDKSNFLNKLNNQGKMY